MPLDLRRGAVEEREVASAQQCKLVEENADKMAVESVGQEGDGVEIVETSGCGGSATGFFNPKTLRVSLRCPTPRFAIDPWDG
jgi:flavoprotein